MSPGWEYLRRGRRIYTILVSGSLIVVAFPLTRLWVDKTDINIAARRRTFYTDGRRDVTNPLWRLCSSNLGKFKYP